MGIAARAWFRYGRGMADQRYEQERENARRYADELSLRYGLERAAAIAERKHLVSARAYWRAVLDRVREHMPRADRHGIMSPVLRSDPA